MAKGKVTLQMLAEVMAANTGRSKTATEQFVRTFFAQLKEALQRDNIVKIKGFGTFKLVVIAARESVNVNTGERVSIAEYNKISFTPDKQLKDRINKPFAQFETINLDDTTDLELIDTDEPETTPEATTTDAATPAAEPATPSIPNDTPIINNVAPTADAAEATTSPAAAPEPTAIAPEPAATTPVPKEAPAPQPSAPAESAAESIATEPTPAQTADEPLAPTSAPQPVASPTAAPTDESSAASAPSANPQTITAQTINASTINASTINASTIKADEPEAPREEPNTTAAEPESHHHHHRWVLYALMALLVAFLVCVAYVAGYHRMTLSNLFDTVLVVTDNAADHTLVQDTASCDTLVATADSSAVTTAASAATAAQSSATSEAADPTATALSPTAADPSATAQSAEPTIEQLRAEADKYPQLEGGAYLMAGVKTTRRVTWGCNLIRFCRQIYGKGDYYIYVVKYNDFKNPNNIPIGTIIKFPYIIPRR